MLHVSSLNLIFNRTFTLSYSLTRDFYSFVLFRILKNYRDDIHNPANSAMNGRNLLETDFQQGERKLKILRFTLEKIAQKTIPLKEMFAMTLTVLVGGGLIFPKTIPMARFDRIRRKFLLIRDYLLLIFAKEIILKSLC